MKIEVILTEAIFRRFTMFDILKRRKAWKAPATFAGILGFSACICFFMHQVRGAVMLGCVLLLVGLGMPAVYFGTFFSSLKKQVRAYGLKSPQHVYTLELTEKAKGIAVNNEREHAEYEWKKVYHVYRDTLATYLYMTPERSFLLPHACVEEGTDALWELICRNIPKEKRTVL